LISNQRASMLVFPGFRKKRKVILLIVPSAKIGGDED